ncbi:hypothetical protein B0H63DRAFT_480726 [Podospora didyma]|uniref:DH domain-containing protein n=1 Tax=Podospora didyma TaxID=330526 RepID=A0AAE0KEY2_9PEZI|nr:hypothetical protein B0H63DRAFT_480726 [Podospora didyma]
MDALTIPCSISGLILSAQAVLDIVRLWTNSANTDTTQWSAHRDNIAGLAKTLSALRDSISALEKTTPAAKHAGLIQINQVVAVLTHGVLIFSELEAAACASLPMLKKVPRNNLKRMLPSSSRPQLTKECEALRSALKRLPESHLGSALTSMVEILQSHSAFKAREQQDLLVRHVNNMLRDDRALSDRLASVERFFDPQSIPVDGPNFALKDDNQAESWVVVDIPPDELLSSEGSLTNDPSLDCDSPKVIATEGSLRDSASRFIPWSTFAGLSLHNLTIVSVVALPVFAGDLMNPQHYEFGSVLQQQSVFHDCVEIKAQLLDLNGFEELFADLGDEPLSDDKLPTSPLAELHRVFSRGFPLLMLFNELPLEPLWENLSFPPPATPRSLQQSVEEFCQACRESMGVKVKDTFTADDLITDHPNVGFLKVVKIIAMILDRLVNCAAVRAVEFQTLMPPTKPDQRASPAINSIVNEFLAEERSYSLLLQTLLDTMARLEKKFPSEFKDSWAYSGLAEPLPRILNCELELLMGLETMALRPFSAQRWGLPFLRTSADEHYQTFVRYENNIGAETRYAYSRPQRVVPDNWKPGFVLSKFHKLLATPFQRLTKYESFLQKLACQPDFSGDQLRDIGRARSAVQSTLLQLTATIREEAMIKRRHQLGNHVEDWKEYSGLHPDRTLQFGSFLKFDILDVVTPSLSVVQSETVSTFHIYLFKKILIFARIRDPARGKTRSWFSTRPEPHSAMLSKREWIFRLKGRILTKEIRLIDVESHGSDLGPCTFWVHWQAGSNPKVDRVAVKCATVAERDSWTKALREVIPAGNLRV